MTMALFFAVSGAHAQPSVKLRLEVGPREITIGDPIGLRATVVFSTDVAPAPLAVPNPLGEFELLDYAPTRPKPLPDGKLTLTHQLVLTTFSTGTQTIPSLSLVFVNPEGTKAEAKTESVDINVKSVLEMMGDQGGLRPLKGFFNFRSYFWVWITLVILLLSGLGALLYWWCRQKKLLEQLQAGPPKPAEEIAWEALHALEDSSLLSDGNIKEYYFQLSLILRQYLENRYLFSALERTTSELLAEFRRLKLTMDLTNELRDSLDNADLVKFAKYTPVEDDIEEDLNRVKRIITITTPQASEKKEEILPV
ncbi:MAG: hypothetical protein LHV69_01945 [Elusimicrobia bacterium]|nr:hypothetical protein [Candidatus Obscuribacterium magneticum]